MKKNMKVLVVGGGGREHAIVWALAKSPRVGQIYCAPGNGGISTLAICVDLAATDLDGMVSFARQQEIDLVFVAADDPLALGMVDRMEAAGVRAFGPHARAAAIESSKAYAKDLMRRHGIPTARYAVFTQVDEAVAYVENHALPLVVKADGLALGKGALIARTREEAHAAVHTMLADRVFGAAGAKVVIEEYMEGSELTVMVFTDGQSIVPMPCARDHKRAYDRDQGLNTGGMGAFVPGHRATDREQRAWMEQIIRPTIDALRSENRRFKGVLYFELMLTPQGAKVIEYNARFGDPEAQVVLPLLRTDLLDVADAVIDERLDQISVAWEPLEACCVVMTSGGYPEKYDTGFEIKGLEAVEGIVFHAGTRRVDSRFLTSGGRVLAVTAVAGHLDDAVEAAYRDVARICFHHQHYRSDIGKRGVRK